MKRMTRMDYNVTSRGSGWRYNEIMSVYVLTTSTIWFS